MTGELAIAVCVADERASRGKRIGRQRPTAGHDLRRPMPRRRQIDQRAGGGIRQVVMCALSVIDAVAAAPGGPPLEPKQLSDQARVVEHVDFAAVQPGQEVPIDFRLRQVCRPVLDALFPEGLANPFRGVAVAAHWPAARNASAAPRTRRRRFPPD